MQVESEASAKLLGRLELGLQLACCILLLMLPLRHDHITLLKQWLPGFYGFQFNFLSFVYHLFP